MFTEAERLLGAVEDAADIAVMADYYYQRGKHAEKLHGQFILHEHGADAQRRGTDYRADGYALCDHGENYEQAYADQEYSPIHHQRHSRADGNAFTALEAEEHGEAVPYHACGSRGGKAPAPAEGKLGYGVAPADQPPCKAGEYALQKISEEG